MAERPILFSAPMVRAILAGQKTQTRRVVRFTLLGGEHVYPEPIVERVAESGSLHWSLPGRAAHLTRCPYGVPGDRLWVRETFGGDDCCGYAYRADHPNQARFEGDGDQPDSPWRPSIHMPRTMSRIQLEVTGVRVERLHDISEDDVYAEGVQIPVTDVDRDGNQYPDGKVAVLQRITGKFPTYRYVSDPTNATAADIVRSHFASLWDAINGKRAPWSSNPWLWVVSFKRVEPS